MKDKKKIQFILNIVLGILFTYNGIRIRYQGGSRIATVLLILFGLIEVYIAYTVYKDRWYEIFKNKT